MNLPLTIENTKKYMPRWPIKNYKLKAKNKEKKKKMPWLVYKKSQTLKVARASTWIAFLMLCIMESSSRDIWSSSSVHCIGEQRKDRFHQKVVSFVWPPKVATGLTYATYIGLVRVPIVSSTSNRWKSRCKSATSTSGWKESCWWISLTVVGSKPSYESIDR